MASVRRALTGVRAPDEYQAEERAWAVVRSAYRERVPSPPKTSNRRLVIALAVATLAGAVALSPAGATVGRLITRALGVRNASTALFSLPAQGRLLVSGAGGTWTVAADGAARRLGPWPQAAWSPHGRYIAVVRGDELTAIDAGGRLQWKLTRPAVADPRWYPPSGYRVVYLSRADLRVVAGDGTADHLLAAGVAKVAPAWRPAHPYQLAYLTAHGRLLVRDADAGGTLWSAAPSPGVRRLEWSANGQRLLALSPAAVRVYTADGRLLDAASLRRGAPAIDGALSPDGRTLALALGGTSGEIVVANLDRPGEPLRRVLAGAGLSQVAWSPDGRWLLVSWPAANQWVFVRVAGTPRITAVSRIAQQFSAGPARGFPHLEGWCCTSPGRSG